MIKESPFELAILQYFRDASMSTAQLIQHIGNLDAEGDAGSSPAPFGCGGDLPGVIAMGRIAG